MLPTGEIAPHKLASWCLPLYALSVLSKSLGRLACEEMHTDILYVSRRGGAACLKGCSCSRAQLQGNVLSPAGQGRCPQP